MDFESYLHSVLCTVIQLPEKFDSILQKLKEVGVEKKEHVKYVNEGDFENILTKIQARMLVEKFQCKYNFEWLKLLIYKLLKMLPCYFQKCLMFGINLAKSVLKYFFFPY